MQKKKIFVEVTISDQIKRRISQKIAKWQTLPVKWTKENNFHLTIAFVGYVDESVIPDICENVAAAVENIDSFDIIFDKIELGPDAENARMVWLSGEPNEQLRFLNEEVEKSLGMFSQSHKIFSPHITLGKIRKNAWDAMLEKPIIEENVSIIVPIDSVDVMESKGGGAEYQLLEECPLA
jgi:2'-5' RNA ligase